MEEIKLADEVGLDVFGVGEHHRRDLAVSTQAVVRSAAAQRTKTIRLTSAVTVLGSDGPVRVFQDFSTLDLLSGGRAEIMVDRSSFIESFPLFGFDLRDHHALFGEKLRLLLELREQEHVTWSGRHCAAIDGLGVYPRPIQDPLPIWSRLVVRLNRQCEPECLGCLGLSRSSAGRPSDSRRSPISTGEPRSKPDMTRCRGWAAHRR